MTTVRCWTGHEARALRLALRLSVRSFADRLGVAVRTVSKWEAGGATTIPRPDTQAILDTALGRAERDTQQRFEQLCRATSTRAAAPFASLHAVPGAPAAESVELLRQMQASDLGAGTLDQLEEAVEHLAVAYFTVPPADFRAQVLVWRRYVATLLDGRTTLRERGRLHLVAGWLTGLLAEVSLALGTDAKVHCATALSLAQEVGHADLAGWVRGTQAQVALYAGDPRDAVAFAQAGRDVARIGSSASFRASALEARAVARSGDTAATECAIRRAEQALDLRTETRIGSLFSFDPPYLPYYAGTACSWLGDVMRARAWASEAIQLCDADAAAWPVARTGARIDLAVALVRARELDAAVATATDAIEIWSRRPTDPASRRIEELLAAVEPFRERSVVELTELWRSMSGSPTINRFRPAGSAGPPP